MRLTSGAVVAELRLDEIAPDFERAELRLVKLVPPVASCELRFFLGDERPSARTPITGDAFLGSLFLYGVGVPPPAAGTGIEPSQWSARDVGLNVTARLLAYLRTRRPRAIPLSAACLDERGADIADPGVECASVELVVS